jgi:hypothetical protein
MHELGRLAQTQHGLVTRGQLLECGFSASKIDRLIRVGRLEPLLKGVYRLEGSPRSWHQEMMGTLLWLGAESAISHRPAAVLHGLSRFEQGTVEAITTLRIRHSPSPDILIHNTDLLLPTYMTNIEGLRVTTIEKTLFDLGAVVPKWKVGKALDEALFLKLTSLSQVKAYLDELSARGRSGGGVIRQLLAERDCLNEKVDTSLELVVIKAIANAGLPIPVAQYPIMDGPYELFRLDLAYPGPKIAIEADDYPSHKLKSVFEKDRRRDNLLQARGWSVLHATRDGMRDFPQEFLNRLRTLLRLVLLQ